MNVEKVVEIDGENYWISVSVSRQPGTNLYRAAARYRDFHQSPEKVHLYSDKEIAINVAVNGLIVECPPKVLRCI